MPLKIKFIKDDDERILPYCEEEDAEKFYFQQILTARFSWGSNIILTKKGAELAKKIKGKYCFFLLMLRYLGVKEENARIDACKMEHSVCDESYQALLDFFFHNHPDIIKQDDKGYKELFF